MMVLDQANSYDFANMVVRVTDNTAIVDDTITPEPDVPEFNLLIPTVQAIGSTNVLELYYAGEPNRYLNAHGTPNPLKYGFGPDFVHAALSQTGSNVGVYTINLRGETATMANIILLLKYKVENGVPYTNSEGEPYYVDANGQLVLTPTDATPVVRDVLHLKFATSVTTCKKWTDLHKEMNYLYSEFEDENGYKTLPLYGVMYRGASSHGNNVYFSMDGRAADFDGQMYYSFSVFDGVKNTVTDYNYSLDLTAGQKYNTSYFVETMFNEAFPTMRMMAAETIDSVYSIINQYAGTLDDYLAGNAPSRTFTDLDIFHADEFAIVTDAGLDVSAPAALKLMNGYDGDETRDELFESFFKGEILTDITSVLRYRMSYIIDTGYNAATKAAIVELCKKRNRMTTCTLMVGGTDTFSSALIDHQANYHEDSPNLRQLAAVQSPMMLNDHIRRTVTYPGTYFDMIAMLEMFARYGNYYQPFAGFDARWHGYIEDTMVYPTESADFLNSLQTNRINVVMKDAYNGAYLNDQLMNTSLISDQTEMNNAFLISNMLYDLLDLVHRNHFKFNEAEQVRLFNEAVNDVINNKYSEHSASLSCEVYRAGTVGRARSANRIVVTIDMYDINKWTTVDIVLVDE